MSRCVFGGEGRGKCRVNLNAKTNHITFNLHNLVFSVDAVSFSMPKCDIVINSQTKLYEYVYIGYVMNDVDAIKTTKPLWLSLL